jgi:mRNA interferase MazF
MCSARSMLRIEDAPLFYRRSVKFSMDQSVKRGDIYYADLSPVVGSEQGGVRPVLIVQNDMGNRHSPTVIAAAITSQINKARLPTHIELSAKTYGLTKDSVVLLEQIRTIDKRRLREKMGRLDESLMHRIDEAIVVSFGLHNGG